MPHWPPPEARSTERQEPRRCRCSSCASLPPPPPPARIRLGHTGIEWNVGEAMPKEAKRAILIEKIVWYGFIASAGLCLVSAWLAMVLR